MIRLLAFLITGIVLLGIYSLFSIDGRDSELVQAVNAVRRASSPIGLSNSMYSEVVTTGKPSEYVNYMFSSLGASELPVSGYFPESLEKEISNDFPTIPSGVVINPFVVNRDAKKQIVLLANDDDDLIIVDAYLDPNEAPVFREQWRFRPPRPR